jgi:hypothetical protein
MLDRLCDFYLAHERAFNVFWECAGVLNVILFLAFVGGWIR